MSSSNFALDAKRHELYKSSETNEPVILDGSLFIRDKITDVLMMIPDTLETRKFFNLSTIRNNLKSCNTSIIPSVSSDADETSTEELIRNNNLDTCNTQSLSSSSDSAPVKWTDNNAVRALISKWKNHESDFKNTQIRNSKVWQMIADDLKKENPLWSFNGTQCENKFKDVRKSYTKVKDHNNQSGAELKTYKFYEEMEAVLGEKPIVKPISIASTLKKR
ncbi:nucleoside diphosphate kinase 6, partial [Lasius niger]